jgi:hypothetical protein
MDLGLPAYIIVLDLMSIMLLIIIKQTPTQALNTAHTLYYNTSVGPTSYPLL